MELLCIVSQQYLHINQKNCLVSIFKFSMKNDFLTKTLPPPKKHIKIFKNKKSNATFQTSIQYTTFHQYTSFTKYLCLLKYRDISTFTPYFFHTSSFDLFDLRNTKIQIWQIPLLSPTQNEPKEPKRSQINPYLDHETAVHKLLVDAAYRCFDLACTDLAYLSPNRATHLKSPEKKPERVNNSFTRNKHQIRGWSDFTEARRHDEDEVMPLPLGSTGETRTDCFCQGKRVNNVTLCHYSLCSSRWFSRRRAHVAFTENDTIMFLVDNKVFPFCMT